MDYNNCSNVIGEIAIRSLGDFGAKCFVLDENNIGRKLINNEWIGKRSVWTLDWRSCWLEETTPENVKSWWCGGKDADYNEVFKRTKPSSVDVALKHFFKQKI